LRANFSKTPTVTVCQLLFREGHESGGVLLQYIEQMSTSEPNRTSPELEHHGASLAAPDVVEQDDPARIDDAVPTAGYRTLPVVGLGGSAGCIQALQRFFESTPSDSGLAYVVVLHLSPSYESSLPQLIARWTSMPVKAASDGDKLEQNSVYVIPSAKHLSAVDGRLRLMPIEQERGKRVAVDLFFRSLADTHGPHAVAVVLSGADGDGAIGIKRIKERGGLTIAQEPDEAEYGSMPQSAIATGMVDWVLPVAEMPARVAQYIRLANRLRTPSEDGPQLTAKARPSHGEAEEALREVLALLRARTGREFSYYKRATVVRRIARRVQVNALEDLPSYLAFLRTHQGEAGALLQDLLISVTNFFRDKEVFQALEAIVPDLFRGKGPGDCVRVWVPACATGEEAYSIAMLLASYARTLDAPPMLQIFGCDLDESAIQVARNGLYPDTIVADVDEPHLRQFFSKELRGYRVRRELRELVLFAAHDLLMEAPFSRMDLVSCRNLLIYLNKDAQRRALDIFHFALRPGGTLLLGSSETVDEGNTLFKSSDKKHRIYQQLPGQKMSLPLVPSAGAFARGLAAHETTRGPAIPGASFARAALQQALQSGPESERLSASELHFRLLERQAPPSLVLNADQEIIHVSSAAGQYLKVPTGEPTMNVLRVIHPSLRVELRAVLAQAAEVEAPVELANVPLQKDGESQAVTLRVVPAREIAPGYSLILFESVTTPEPAAELSEEVRAQRPVVERLEGEIDVLRMQLRENVEQYVTSTEELKAGNEELHAMNEELRSATEELQSSREELQSINEETSTTNGELKSKLDELGRANSDLRNLMASTNIATVFLDRQLRITRFTPSAVGLFNVIATDVGRPLDDLRHRLDYPGLAEDAQLVLEKLAHIEREVHAGEQWYLARVLPYRTVDDHIAGLVLTFVDITANKAVEEELRQSQERLQLIVENARDYAIFSIDLQRRITSWNSGAQQILGYTREEALGKSADIIFTKEDRACGAPEQEAAAALEDGRAMDQRWHLRKDGSTFWGNGTLMPMHNTDGLAIGFVKIFRDETDELHAKQALEKGRQELLTALGEMERARAEAVAAGRAKDHFLAVLSHELRTPLTPVLMAARLLSRRKDLPPEASEALAMIERNVQLEAQFIDDLLDVTRISRGKLELVLERVDVHEAVRRAVEVTRTEIEAKSQALQLELEAAEHQVLGDGRRLQQVFWNLLKNASKFTPEQGTIRVVSRNERGRISVEVHDTGVGFDPSEGDRIFAAFEQANDSVSREFGGLGLGLAIVKATVEAHGGTIRAHSAGKARGATFCLELTLENKGATND
jgi:two-component system, chemotaxis family, CheB/CheR fusion protein